MTGVLCWKCHRKELLSGRIFPSQKSSPDLHLSHAVSHHQEGSDKQEYAKRTLQIIAFPDNQDKDFQAIEQHILISLSTLSLAIVCGAHPYTQNHLTYFFIFLPFCFFFFFNMRLHRQQKMFKPKTLKSMVFSWQHRKPAGRKKPWVLSLGRR